MIDQDAGRPSIPEDVMSIINCTTGSSTKGKMSLVDTTQNLRIEAVKQVASNFLSCEHPPSNPIPATMEELAESKKSEAPDRTNRKVPTGRPMRLTGAQTDSRARRKAKTKLTPLVTKTAIIVSQQASWENAVWRLGRKMVWI